MARPGTTFVDEEKAAQAAKQKRIQRERAEAAREGYADAIKRAEAKVKACDQTLAKLEKIQELWCDIPKDVLVGGVQANFAGQDLASKAKKAVAVTRDRATDDLTRAKSARETNERQIADLS